VPQREGEREGERDEEGYASAYAVWAQRACACALAVARLHNTALGQQRKVRTTGGSLKCVGPRKEKRRSRPRRQSPTSTMGHEGSQVASCGTWMQCAKTGASAGARARCCACAHARLRGALEKAAASEATRLRMMQGGGVRRHAARKEDAAGWPCRARQRGDGRSAPRPSRSSRRRGGTNA
jgi:hypothetical protein